MAFFLKSGQKLDPTPLTGTPTSIFEQKGEGLMLLLTTELIEHVFYCSKQRYLARTEKWYICGIAYYS